MNMLHGRDKVYLLEKTTEVELIEMEFSRLPKYAPSEEVEKRMETISLLSIIIGDNLSDNCLKHYDNIE